MAKKTPKRKKLDRLDKLYKEYIAKRDNNTCVVCKKNLDGCNKHVSHIFPQRQYPRLSFEPTNGVLMCFHHHLNWWHKNPVEATEWLKEEYPEFLEAAKEARDNITASGTRSMDELTQIEETLETLINDLNNKKEI